MLDSICLLSWNIAFCQQIFCNSIQTKYSTLFHGKHFAFCNFLPKSNLFCFSYLLFNGTMKIKRYVKDSKLVQRLLCYKNLVYKILRMIQLVCHKNLFVMLFLIFIKFRKQFFVITAAATLVNAQYYRVRQ